jgi:ATP-binding cassette subfamily B protein/ATP-binding cassette subfamily C protein
MRPEKIAELRLYGLVRYLLDLRQATRDKDEKIRIAFERSFIWKRLGASVIESVAEVITLVWVTMQIIARQQPIGQFLYVQQVVSRAMGGASSFVSNINSLDEDLANLFDYQLFMELPEGKVGDAGAVGSFEQLDVNHVSFCYPGSTVNVLSDITFSIHEGQHVAIVGENGAGKTTLVKLITGLYEPTKGKILVNGMLLASINASMWHQMLSVLGQDFIKYDFATAKDNIAYGDVTSRFDDDRLARAIERAEAGFLHKLPYGLNTYIDQWMEGENGEKGQDLSGGQWQRVALARNFYRDSPVIILDEPTSAIDALAESRIFKRLFTLKEKTIITVSHRLTTIEKADVVYMLKDGVVVECGTAKELIAKRGEFYTMFESQIHN